MRLEQNEEGITYRWVNRDPLNSLDSDNSALESELTRFFDLKRKYEIPKEDANLTNAVAKYEGIRQLQLDPIETLYSFICSSNNHITRFA